MENTLSKKSTQAKPKQKAKLSVGSVSLILLLTFLALVTLIPFLWMISASFKNLFVKLSETTALHLHNSKRLPRVFGSLMIS